MSNGKPSGGLQAAATAFGGVAIGLLLIWLATAVAGSEGRLKPVAGWFESGGKAVWALISAAGLNGVVLLFKQAGDVTGTGIRFYLGWIFGLGLSIGIVVLGFALVIKGPLGDEIVAGPSPIPEVCNHQPAIASMRSWLKYLREDQKIINQKTTSPQTFPNYQIAKRRADSLRAHLEGVQALIDSVADADVRCNASGPTAGH